MFGEMLGETDSSWESMGPVAGVAVRGLWLWIRVGAVTGSPALLYRSDCCGEAVVKIWGSSTVTGLAARPVWAGSVVQDENCLHRGWAVTEVSSCPRLWVSGCCKALLGPGLMGVWDDSWGVQL